MVGVRSKKEELRGEGARKRDVWGEKLRKGRV